MITLMALLVLTVLAITAISTTTTEIRITGNAKLQELVFYGADGGSRSYPPILKETLKTGSFVPAKYVTPMGPVQDAANFAAEVFGTAGDDGLIDSASDSTPDLYADLEPVEVGVDVDRITEGYISGSAIEFASGYEGIGLAAAQGGVGIFYQADSLGHMRRSRAQVSEVYIHHVQQ